MDRCSLASVKGVINMDLIEKLTQAYRFIEENRFPESAVVFEEVVAWCRTNQARDGEEYFGSLLSLAILYSDELGDIQKGKLNYLELIDSVVSRPGGSADVSFIGFECAMQGLIRLGLLHARIREFPDAEKRLLEAKELVGEAFEGKEFDQQVKAIDGYLSNVRKQAASKK